MGNTPQRWLPKWSTFYLLNLGGAILAAVLILSPFPSFWNYSRLIKGTILVLLAAVCFFFLVKVTNTARRRWNASSIPERMVSLGLSAGIGLILGVSGLSLQASISPLLYGRGELIQNLINLLIKAIGQPAGILVILLLVSDGYVRFSVREYLRAYSTHGFVILFLGFSLLPLTKVTNIANVAQGFWGREWLIDAYAKMSLSLGNRVIDQGVVGGDQWLLYMNEFYHYQAITPYTDQQLALVQQKLDSFSDRLAAQGIKLLVIIPPNKSTIYHEYVPPEIPLVGRESYIDQLVNYQKQNGKIKIVDLRPALFAARDKRIVYSRTDTHWNSYGSFVAYQEIMKKIQSWYPALQPHAETDYQFVKTPYAGDMGTRIFKTTIWEDETEMKPLFPSTVTARKANFLAEDGTTTTYRSIITWSSDPTLPRLVGIGDSYYFRIQPYLSEHFSRATYLLNGSFDESFIAMEKPDIVILEFVERNLYSLMNLP